tara:strand:+ start:503 stop:613 length:111 start_codon:yes stop_codon:yes gene_type:complete
VEILLAQAMEVQEVSEQQVQLIPHQQEELEVEVVLE